MRVDKEESATPNREKHPAQTHHPALTSILVMLWPRRSLFVSAPEPVQLLWLQRASCDLKPKIGTLTSHTVERTGSVSDDTPVRVHFSLVLTVFFFDRLKQRRRRGRARQPRQSVRQRQHSQGECQRSHSSSEL